MNAYVINVFTINYYSQSEIKCEKSFVMLSAYFLRKIHSIMTNCKFVIGNEVKPTWMYTRSFTCVQDDNTSRFFRKPILFYYNY